LMVSPLTNLCNRCVIAIMNGMIQKLIVAQSCSPTNKISHNNTYIYIWTHGSLINKTNILKEPMFLCFDDLCVCLSAPLSDQSDEHALTLCLTIVVTFHPTIVK
jgi:hypothetical protein